MESSGHAERAHRVDIQFVSTRAAQYELHELALLTVIYRIGNLRLASQNNRDPPNLQKMVEIAIGFEKGIFEKSMNKARTGSARTESHANSVLGCLQC